MRRRHYIRNMVDMELGNKSFNGFSGSGRNMSGIICDSLLDHC